MLNLFMPVQDGFDLGTVQVSAAVVTATPTGGTAEGMTLSSNAATVSLDQTPALSVQVTTDTATVFDGGKHGSQTQETLVFAQHSAKELSAPLASTGYAATQGRHRVGHALIVDISPAAQCLEA
jgi:hypothetical protein